MEERPRLMTQKQGSWRKRKGQQRDLGVRLAEVKAGLQRGFGLGLVTDGHFTSVLRCNDLVGPY